MMSSKKKHMSEMLKEKMLQEINYLVVVYFLIIQSYHSLIQD